MFRIRKREDLEKVEELASLQCQVEAVRLQDKLGKQNFHENMRKVFEPIGKSLESTSQDVKKTVTEASIKNNWAFSELSEKVLELMNEKNMIATYLAFSLVYLFKPESKSQYILI